MLRITDTSQHIAYLTWLREHLGGELEQTIREFAGSNDAQAPKVAAFIQRVDARLGSSLVVSDVDYAKGIAMLYSFDLMSFNKASYLISLGGHDVAKYIQE